MFISFLLSNVINSFKIFITFFLKTLHVNLCHSICVEARGQLAKVRSHLLSRGFPGMRLRSSGLAAGVVTHWAISLTLDRSFLLVSQGLVQMLLPLGNITLASIDVWGKRSPFFLCGFLAIKVTLFECRAVGTADLQKDTMEVSHHLDTGVTHYFVFFLCIFLLSFLCTHTKLDMHRKTMVFMCMLVFNFISQL